MHPVNYFAYLDAGTGSLIIQSIVGIVAGIAVFARRFVMAIPVKLGAIFKRDKKTSETTEK